METVVFMFCVTLHNIEEALWLSEWKSKAMPNSRRLTNKNCLIFAALGVTVLCYMVAGLHLLLPNSQHMEYAFIGFVGAMLVNAVIPHIFMTIKFKRYCPGVLTGSLLIIPFHWIILFNAVSTHLKASEIVISTFVVGTILLCAIYIFDRLAINIFKS